MTCGAIGAGWGTGGAIAVGEAAGPRSAGAVCGTGSRRTGAGAGERGCGVAAAAGVGVGVAGVGVGVARGGPMLKRSGTIPGIVVIVGGGICAGAGVGVGVACWACAGKAASATINPGRIFPACTPFA